MKLSEAIRLGAMLRPQSNGVLDSLRYGGGKSCVLEAAVEAIGEDVAQVYPSAERAFPIMQHIDACPACGKARSCFTCLIDDHTAVLWHLNDWHKWTREQIADWVASIEQAQDAQAEPVTASVTA